MTTGALIFAYDNESFDYVRMAAWAAANIRRHLGIPVAVVSDRPVDSGFDQVILQENVAQDTRWFGDVNQRMAWNNRGRPDAFDLSPWDRTLLLDADYVVASCRLASLLDLPTQYPLCHRWACDLTGRDDLQGLNYFGQYHMPLYWATVVMFDKNAATKMVFDCMKMIRSNWTHYKNIYHDRSKTYRNDHALTIALNTVNGHYPHLDHIPWALATVMPDVRLGQIDQDRYRFDFVKSDNRPAYLEMCDHDFHAMNKKSLLDLIS